MVGAALSIWMHFLQRSSDHIMFSQQHCHFPGRCCGRWVFWAAHGWQLEAFYFGEDLYGADGSTRRAWRTRQPFPSYSLVVARRSTVFLVYLTYELSEHKTDWMATRISSAMQTFSRHGSPCTLLYTTTTTAKYKDRLEASRSSANPVVLHSAFRL